MDIETAHGKASTGPVELAADPALAFVICGHSHVPALIEVEAGRWYVNSGDWLSHFTYVKVTDGGAPTMERWPVGAPATGATARAR